jgi:uncharacterized SAM-binding protein YcdF (DUF218 family)
VLSRPTVVALVGALSLLVWSQRDTLLSTMGTAIVHEDALVPVDAVVVSNASVRAGALEAARLFRAGLTHRVVIPTWPADPVDGDLHRLGVPVLGPTQLAQTILAHSGLPRHAVTVLSDPVDGTGAETAAVARYVQTSGVTSVLFLTARTHTARARWLLARRLPHGVRATVRSPRQDRFDPERWWRDEGSGREVAFEYLRWLHDLAVHG